MSQFFAMAVPILPGKTEEFKSFTNELNGSRSEEFKASRKKLNVRERTFLQETPQGDFVLVTLEGENPEAAFQQFAQGNDEFTKWFLDHVKSIHGLDLSQPPQGALPKMIIDSGEIKVSEPVM